MNEIFQLKGRFETRSNAVGFGATKLPAQAYVTSNHIRELSSQLKSIEEYWQNNHDIDGALVSVHYTRVVAKSNRVKILLSDQGQDTISSIRGAKFVDGKDLNGNSCKKHVFTHFVQLTAIDRAINYLKLVADIVDKEYSGCIKSEHTDELVNNKSFGYSQIIAKTNFIKVIVDAYFVERFDIDTISEPDLETSIVTLYKTNVSTRELLSRLGIEVFDSNIIDENTVMLEPGQAQALYLRAPYLVSMSVTDFSKINYDEAVHDTQVDEEDNMIPHPANEPIVGVIDTHFNTSVYFSEWVDYRNMLSVDIELNDEDYCHGTEVSSIIVDGPRGNPKLDDGCGRFRVRHFGVAKHGGFSSFTVLKLIREIVVNNPDIKVWNLSLGSMYQINEDSISPVAAELDRIQNENEVIFIVAGTNKPRSTTINDMRIGSPADSLNSIVVNSVDMNDRKASYSRKGPVLSFFHKPDLSYYGGDGNTGSTLITVCNNTLGASYQAGTSYAAPWITRKVAYLVYVMGMSREIAKALLIDSAIKWKANSAVSDYLGYGVVPIKIEDILHSSDDEIKFYITGATEDYEMYNYSLPVPIVDGKHPFYARAVIAYFPPCDRNQGVDYTCAELDIHFGRVKENGKLATLDDNRQTEDGVKIYESEARKLYRKWDNVKRLCEEIKTKSIPRKAYGAGMWGISIFTKDRISSKNRKLLPFGLVVTLKEMNGKNRMDEFIKSCMAHGWLVNRINVKTQLDINAKAEEEIEFE